MSGSRLYRGGQRKLQAEFGSEPLADRLEAKNLRTELGDKDRSIIENAPFFFLATSDTEAQPNVSYKGGNRGFVRVVSPTELAYPDYDGNGMFMSLGNVIENPKVALLFIDFETSTRLALRGSASLHRDDPLLPHTVGAQLIVRIQVSALYPNCPRYIHQMKFQQLSPYAPTEGAAPLEPAWKSFPEFSDVVPPRRRAAESGDD